MHDDTNTTTAAPETDRDRMHALALRTARSIEEEAAAVRLLQEHESYTLDDLDADDRVAVLDARETLELDSLPCDCPKNRPAGIVHYPGCERFESDVADGVEDWLERNRYESPLAVHREGSNHGEGWSTDSVVILLGTGGPHVQVRYRGDSAYVESWDWFGAGRCDVPVDSDDVELLYGVDYLYRDEDSDW